MDIRSRTKESPHFRNEADYAELAEHLKALAHPHRLRMVQMLLHEHYTVGELADACGIPSHMASEHLRMMQRAGVLTRTKIGRRAYYHVADTQSATAQAFLKKTPRP